MKASRNTIAKRYAKALFELAENSKMQGEIKNDIGVIAALLTNVNLKTIFFSPVFSVAEKLDVFNALKNKAPFSKLVISFIEMLIEKRRLQLFPEIEMEFTNFYNDVNGIKRVAVTSAMEMSIDVKHKFSQNLEKLLQKKVTVQYKTDSKLIGGFITEVDSLMMDASLKSQLNQLQKNLQEKVGSRP